MLTKATLISHIGQLLSLAPLRVKPYGEPIEAADLGSLENAWLLVVAGKVCDYGPMPVPAAIKNQAALIEVDAEGALCLPGLVDSHTHPLFAGERSNEFAARLAGKTYQEIAAAGGGIAATVQATRQARDEELHRLCQQRLAGFLAYGVTTCEVKTGYGLSVAEELRGVRILHRLKQHSSQTLRVTCLALHAVGREFASTRAYVEAMSEELLPSLARQQLADGVDAFIENGYFSPGDCHEYMRTAQKLGLSIRIHADEFSDAGGAEAAAHWGAQSADHLQQASNQGLKAMAAAGVVATLLPGTSLYTGIPFVDGRKVIAAGCRVALGSDFNPGSCYLGNLPLIASIAGVHCQLRPWEILAGITYVPACSLALGERKGCLAKGYDADFILHPAGSLEAYLADMGQQLPASVWIGGELVVASPRQAC